MDLQRLHAAPGATHAGSGAALVSPSHAMEHVPIARYRLITAKLASLSAKVQELTAENQALKQLQAETAQQHAQPSSSPRQTQPALAASPATPPTPECTQCKLANKRCKAAQARALVLELQLESHKEALHSARRQTQFASPTGHPAVRQAAAELVRDIATQLDSEQAKAGPPTTPDVPRDDGFHTPAGSPTVYLFRSSASPTYHTPAKPRVRVALQPFSPNTPQVVCETKAELGAHAHSTPGSFFSTLAGARSMVTVKRAMAPSGRAPAAANASAGMQSAVKAIQAHEPAALQALLSSGRLSPDARLRDGTPLLVFAACAGAHRCVRELLRQGAARSATDAKGRTALDYAVSKQAMRVMAALTSAVPAVRLD